MKLLCLLHIAITATLLPVVSIPAQTSLPGNSQNSSNHPGDSTASGNVIVKRNIPYVANGHVRQTLDLYIPVAGHPVPLVVWVHGGAWKLGSKDWINVKYLIQQGYAIASVDYRFSGDAKFPAQIQDCNAALNFLMANAASYGIDPKRLVVGGGSAGGHLALLLGLARRETTVWRRPLHSTACDPRFFRARGSHLHARGSRPRSRARRGLKMLSTVSWALHQRCARTWPGSRAPSPMSVPEIRRF